MFAIRLRNLRKSKKLTQAQFAEHFHIASGTIAMWETGKRSPDAETMKRLADFFDVSVDYLLGREEPQKTKKNTFMVPVLGQVAAGVPIEAIEEILDYEELNADDFNPAYEYFGLRIKGESMSPKIQDGDTVIVRKQSDVESGDIAIVCVNGDTATCKQIKKHADGISLVPLNSVFDVRFFTNSEVMDLPITIIGKVVELRRKF